MSRKKKNEEENDPREDAATEEAEQPEEVEQPEDSDTEEDSPPKVRSRAKARTVAAVAAEVEGLRARTEAIESILRAQGWGRALEAAIE